jgi:hypothetical protein
MAKIYKFPGCTQSIAEAVNELEMEDGIGIVEGLRQIVVNMTQDQEEWLDAFDKAWGDDWESQDDYPNDGLHDNPNYKCQGIYLCPDGTVVDGWEETPKTAPSWCGAQTWLNPDGTIWPPEKALRTPALLMDWRGYI